MITRCTNPKRHNYKHYGGRGVRVHPSWLGPRGFERFHRHVGDPPSAKHSLDRYPDKEGDYKPGNVRWATQQEQCRNKTNNVLVEFQGRELTLKEWAAEFGLKYHAVYRRYRAGRRGADLFAKRYARRKP